MDGAPRPEALAPVLLEKLEAVLSEPRESAMERYRAECITLGRRVAVTGGGRRYLLGTCRGHRPNRGSFGGDGTGEDRGDSLRRGHLHQPQNLNAAGEYVPPHACRNCLSRLRLRQFC